MRAGGEVEIQIDEILDSQYNANADEDEIQGVNLQ